jgi:hypothetical protein
MVNDVCVFFRSNGFSSGIASFARAMGPVCMGLIWSSSLNYEFKNGVGSSLPILNRNASFYTIVLFHIASILVCLRIPQEFNKPKPPQPRKGKRLCSSIAETCTLLDMSPTDQFNKKKLIVVF